MYDDVCEGDEVRLAELEPVAVPEPVAALEKVALAVALWVRVRVPEPDALWLGLPVTELDDDLERVSVPVGEPLRLALPVADRDTVGLADAEPVSLLLRLWDRVGVPE